MKDDLFDKSTCSGERLTALGRGRRRPETSDLVAGWWMIDVDSHDRAVELAPARTWVRYGGPDAAPVTTDGPRRAARGERRVPRAAPGRRGSA